METEGRKTVVITDLRTAPAQEAEKYLRDLGYNVVAVPGTIRLWKEEEVRAFAETVRDDLIGVIHPAPPAVPGGILEITEEQWEQNTNEGPLAALAVTKVFCGIFEEKKRGSMIYLNSIHAHKPMGKGYLYSMGCAAAEMLSKEAGQDYGNFGVNVFFVEAGPLESDTEVRKSDVSPLYCGVDLRYPTRKIPESGYLNGLLAFLLTDEAYPLTASPIEADAGYMGFYYHRRRVEGRPYAERDNK